MPQTFNKEVEAFAVLGAVGIILLLILFVVFSPFFTICSINILFGTAIPITFKTWLSAVWLGSVVGGIRAASFISNKKDN